MKLVPISRESEAARILYELLRERSGGDPHVNISHLRLPTWDEHVAFVKSRPYRYWYLLQVAEEMEPLKHVGYISCTRLNEIGIVLSKAHRGRGYGRQALMQFIADHEPLPAIPSKRSGRFLAHINPKNAASIKLFTGAGFAHIQQTYAL